MISLLCSEGSVIAYYWSEFLVPKYREKDLDRAMADKQSLIQKLNPRLRNPVLMVESIVAFRECCLSDSWASAWDWGGKGGLVAPGVSLEGFCCQLQPSFGCLWLLGQLEG